MTRLIITTESFPGEVLLTYTDAPAARLITVQLEGAELTEEQAAWIMSHVPITLSQDGLEYLQRKRLTVTSEDYHVTFEMWWSKYNHKINRLRAERLWGKLSKADQVKAFAGLTPYLRHLKANAWKNQADPETYLKNRYWENQWKS